MKVLVWDSGDTLGRCNRSHRLEYEDKGSHYFLLLCSSQVSIADIGYDEVYDATGEVPCRGLSEESLKKLPRHIILDKVAAEQSICCTICLQDIEGGEIARSLPRCQHTFQLSCVDKWLIRHGSCPVCRQDV